MRAEGSPSDALSPNGCTSGQCHARLDPDFVQVSNQEFMPLAIEIELTADPVTVTTTRLASTLALEPSAGDHEINRGEDWGSAPTGMHDVPASGFRVWVARPPRKGTSRDPASLPPQRRRCAATLSQAPSCGLDRVSRLQSNVSAPCACHGRSRSCYRRATGL